MEMYSDKAESLTGNLAGAKYIVSGGRGLGNREGFSRLLCFADLIHAQVGGTRGAVDLGWIDKRREIGMSGKRVHPKLYIACGLSGANFHTIGIEHADIIVAINTDKKARIFELADIGILADAKEYLTQLNRFLQEHQEQLTGQRPEEYLLPYFEKSLQ